MCWGWLQDKTEMSYKIYLALVLEAMEDLGMKFDIQSVTSDFELAIMKAVDEVLQVDILGCFFHLKKVFTNKVDKKGFKIRYQHDEKFRSFINSCASIAHLPLPLLTVHC